MFGLGTQEILLLLLLALLLFGASKLPAIGRAIGQSIKEFKKGFQGENKDEKDDDNTKK
ncbi:twin-arginine translocase TatA/TatE family subunit [Elusimicrobiota bacterium]